MSNISLIIGSINGEDVLHKVPVIRHLDKKHNIYVASRIKPEVHLDEMFKKIFGNRQFQDIQNSITELNEMAEEFSVIYDSPFLRKKYSEAEIEELQRWLGISLTYIASFDRRFYDRKNMRDSRNNIDLINFLSGILEFFRDFFINYQINVFITTLEDDIFYVTGYYVAKRLGLDIISFGSGRFPRQSVMFSKDFVDIPIWNENNVDWSEIESLYMDSTISGRDMLNRNTRYWKLGSLPQRVMGIPLRYKYENYVKQISEYYGYDCLIYENPRIISQIVRYLKGLWRCHMINIISKDPDYKDKYFLFPLHYIDDAQITFKEPLLDQFKLVSNISRSLPIGYYLYVKPHPHYLGTDVGFKELYKLSKLKNVRLIDPVIRPANLIKNSQGVITVNSTTGFEALILGVPVLTFGHDFYCKKNLCYVVRDINQLSETLINMINGDGQPNRTEIMEFIKGIYSNVIWIEPVHYDRTLIDYAISDSDGRKIAFALNRIIERS